MVKTLFLSKTNGVRVYAPRTIPIRLLRTRSGIRTIVFDRIEHVRLVNKRIRYMKYGHEHRYRLKLTIYNPSLGPVFIYEL